MKKRPEDSVPEHEEGTAVNVEDSVKFSNDKDAQAFFQQVKERLLNVNDWHNHAGPLSAVFQLTDAHGNNVARKPQKGDYFKINIPAPGAEAGDGFDWVRVEETAEISEAAEEFLSLRVRPSSSPVNEDPGIAHFYSGEATSNFIVRREGLKVIAGVYGRNEKPNVKETDGLLDKLRNAVVGVSATIFSKLQWKALVSGLLGK